jgi:pimeloyl-ACP methyl ester carboxylesterase
MIYLLLVVGFLVYVLFISRSDALGRFIYTQSMNIEQRMAKLHASTMVVDGTPISFYQTAKDASKPVLLLLHGFSADKKIWHRFAMKAQKDFQLVIPDMLGHGNTPYSANQSYSTLKQSTMLLALMKQLDIPHYCVIGNSMGGMIAMHLLKQAPEQVQRAILIDPAGAKSDYAKWMQASSHNPFYHKNIRDFFAFYKGTMAKAPFVPPCVLHYIGRVNYIERSAQLSHMFSDFFNIDEFFEDVFDVEQEKLKLIWGDQDELLPLSEAKVWERLTQRPAHIYKGYGHMPMVEAPNRCYRDCKAFIQT